MQPVARGKGLPLDCQVEPGVPGWVNGDANRLRQVLLNLLSNAIKFTEAGKVEVRLSAEEEKEGPRLVFAVKDTGIGIPEEKLPLLFQKFSQVDSSSTRRFSGTGLGLAICRRLVELMGGALEVKSQVNRGSTFLVYLPYVPGAISSPPAVQGDGAAHPIREGLLVLLAEDNVVNRKVAERMLTNSAAAGKWR